MELRLSLPILDLAFLGDDVFRSLLPTIFMLWLTWGPLLYSVAAELSRDFSSRCRIVLAFSYVLLYEVARCRR